MKQIITIGRQFGSGGLETGEKLAKKLGYAFYDQQILQAVSRKLGVWESILETSEESRSNDLLYSLFMRDDRKDRFEEKVFKLEARFLREQADKGPCVIVGRCANYIFAKDPGLLSVFISAPLDARVSRVAAATNISPEEAKRRIAAVDKRRARFYQHYTNGKWDDISQYHMVIDRTLLGVDGTVDLLTQLVKEREAVL